MAQVNYATPGNGASVFSASSTYNPGGNPYAKENIIDGNDGTAWISNANNVGGGTNIIVDLGQARTIAAVRAYHGAYHNTFLVQSSSSSGGPWTTQALGHSPWDVQANITPISARYWRLIYTSDENEGNQLLSLELLSEAYSRPGDFDHARITSGVIVAAFSEYNPGGHPFRVTNVNDGNDGTAWVAGQNSVTNHWVRYTFADPYEPAIYSVRIANTTYVNGWKVQSSPDGSNWTDQVIGTSPNDTVAVISPPVQALNWRIIYTSGNAGAEIPIFELRGQPAVLGQPIVVIA